MESGLGIGGKVKSLSLIQEGFLLEQMVKKAKGWTSQPRYIWKTVVIIELGSFKLLLEYIFYFIHNLISAFNFSFFAIFSFVLLLLLGAAEHLLRRTIVSCGTVLYLVSCLRWLICRRFHPKVHLSGAYCCLMSRGVWWWRAVMAQSAGFCRQSTNWNWK